MGVRADRHSDRRVYTLLVTHRTLEVRPLLKLAKACAILASMQRVEALTETAGATLWIEHNKAFANTLKKASAFYD